MTVTEAAAGRALLREATRLHADRSTASDGILPSAAHTKASPTSHHERGNAIDLTHDPAHGVDCAQIAERLRARAVAGHEPRVLELIHNRRIATRARQWTWRSYSGRNPHTSHLHITLDPTHRDDTSPWLAPAAPSPADRKDRDVTADELRRIVREEVDQAVALVLRGDKTHPDHLKAIRAELHALREQLAEG